MSCWGSKELIIRNGCTLGTVESTLYWTSLSDSLIVILNWSCISILANLCHLSNIINPTLCFGDNFWRLSISHKLSILPRILDLRFRHLREPAADEVVHLTVGYFVTGDIRGLYFRVRSQLHPFSRLILVNDGAPHDSTMILKSLLLVLRCQEKTQHSSRCCIVLPLLRLIWALWVVLFCQSISTSCYVSVSASELVALSCPNSSGSLRGISWRWSLPVVQKNRIPSVRGAWFACGVNWLPISSLRSAFPPPLAPWRFGSLMGLWMTAPTFIFLKLLL